MKRLLTRILDWLFSEPHNPALSDLEMDLNAQMQEDWKMRKERQRERT